MSESENKISQKDTRDVVSLIEKAALDVKEQLEIPIRHYFSKDVYAREMVMPKGSLVVGKIHKFEQLNILSGGEVSVLSQDGSVRFKAPYTYVGTPGAKRVIYAHEEATWTVILGTGIRDVEEIEKVFIAKSYDELLPAEIKTLIEEQL